MQLYLLTCSSPAAGPTSSSAPSGSSRTAIEVASLHFWYSLILLLFDKDSNVVPSNTTNANKLVFIYKANIL